MKYLELNNEVMQKKDGFFQLDKDQKAIVEYLKEVDKRTKKFNGVNERMHWLIDNNFYEDVYQHYTEAQIEELSNILYACQFEFASYMAVSKFYLDYAMKTDDKSQYLETYEDRILITSLYLAQGDFEKAKQMAVAMIEQRYQPATPTFLNSGKARRGEMVSCFLLEVDDSLNSINYIISTAMQLSKIGGGVGINLSKLRSRGESIKGVANAAKGVVPVMKLLEDAFNYADQMGQRKGAGAVYLNIFHKDVIEFLDTKKINADEKSRIQTLSLGLIVPDKFFELAGKGEDFYTFSPYSVYKKYNQHLDDMDIDVMYDTLVADSDVEKQPHSARQFLIKIAQTQFESGYPYIVYSSEANRANPLKDVGRIKMSNLCVTGDTRIATDRGYITAEELYRTKEKLQVLIDNRTKNGSLAETGVSEVAAIPMHMTNPCAKVYRLQTSEGYYIKATEYHEVFVQKESKAQLVPLKDIQAGDRVLIQSGQGNFGSDSFEMDAYIMGLIAGEGSYSGNTGDTNNVVHLNIFEDGVLQTAEKLEAHIAKSIATLEPKLISSQSSLEPKFIDCEQSDNSTLKRLSSANLAKVLDFNYAFNKETRRKVPARLYGATQSTISAYLSGLIQTDSFLYVNENSKSASLHVGSTSKNFLMELQQLMLMLGVYSSIYSLNRNTGLIPAKHRNSTDNVVQALYLLYVEDRKSLEILCSFIELSNREQLKYIEWQKGLTEETCDPKHNFMATVEAITYVGEEPVYDTTQPEYHSLIFNGIVTSNCTEIFQVQTTSVINDYGVDDVIGHDISCNLGSINIANVMEKKDIKNSVHIGMEALTAVSDMSSIANAPGVRKANEDFHSVGLGAMNLHGFLAKNHIMYESEEARDFVRTFFMAVNYYSIEKSMMIARDRKETFHGFKDSEYAKGTYFDKYLSTDYHPKTTQVCALFNGIEIPTIQMWEHLKKDVMQYGLYHAYRLTIAPTQSISYVQNATPSIMPVVDHIEARTYGNATTYYPMPYLSKEIFFYYKSAYNMDMINMIDLVAEIQPHIDQGISTILYVTSDTNTRDLAKYYIYAQRKGLKSLYYTRTKNLTVDDCVACAV